MENLVNGLSKIDAGLISKLLHKPQTPMEIYASKIYKDNPFLKNHMKNFILSDIFICQISYVRLTQELTKKNIYIDVI
jgi:response regulator of citrate/malate metabolism